MRLSSLRQLARLFRLVSLQALPCCPRRLEPGLLWQHRLQYPCRSRDTDGRFRLRSHVFCSNLFRTARVSVFLRLLSCFFLCGQCATRNFLAHGHNTSFLLLT
ncbi:hypothetical protein KCU59_g31, partial [Aureobasidium melanogenum]